MPEKERSPSISGGVRIGDSRYEADFVLRVLEPFVSEERRARIEAVIAGRTYDVVTVVEGVSNLGNVGAVMRSAEALGFQEFHIVEGSGHYKTSSRSTQGAHKWLDVHAWSSPAPAIEYLKERGCRILATSISPDSVDIADVDFSTPAALVFGNEVEGVSQPFIDAADAVVAVKTSGFVESFNISVAAAICLYHVQSWRRHRLPDCRLPADVANVLRARFFALSVREPGAHLARAALARG